MSSAALAWLMPSSAATRKRAGPVDDGEIDGLGLPTLVACHRLVFGDFKNAPGGLGVNVGVGLKGFHQAGVFGDMGEQPQFNLRIVGGDQHMAGRGDKGFSDFAPDFGANRDVLQIGVAGRQPPGAGNGLVQRRMHFARFGLISAGRASA